MPTNEMPPGGRLASLRYGRTRNSLVPRQRTGFTNLPKAEALRDSLIAGSKSEEVHGLRIGEWVQKDLASHKHELGEKTYGQYELHLGRLRDTFAVRKLLAGFQLEDVSRLLGHSSVKVTETYYAKWVPRRKLRLERLLAEPLVNA
jgi:integrase